MTDAKEPDSPSNFDEAITYLKKGGGADVVVTGLFLSHGIPMAPSIVQRVRLGIGRLIDGSFDLLAGKMERAKARADFDAKVKQQVVKAVAQAGAKDLASESPDISTTVALSMLREYGLRFDNKAAVARQALQELAEHPAAHDQAPEASLNSDWLNYFSDVAAQKSDPDMQKLMGQILAGEIRKPGSFSPMTVSVLSTLTIATAHKFYDLCRVAVELNGHLLIPTDLFPAFHNKGVEEVGVTYMDLLTLRSHQLLAPEVVSSNFNMKGGDIGIMAYCDARALLRATGIGEQPIPVALFSQVGNEMRRLISPQPLPGFLEKLSARFIPPNWKFDVMVEVPPSSGSHQRENDDARRADPEGGKI